MARSRSLYAVSGTRRVSAHGAVLGGALTSKVLATVVAVGSTAAVAGMGTFATFNDAVTATPTVTAGTVDVAFGTTNTLATNASGLVPGDSFQRVFDLTNTGNQDLASLTMAVSGSGSTLLTTDTTDGLQLLLQSCATAWTGSPGSYACAGGASTVSAAGAIVRSGVAMPAALLTANPGTPPVSHLMATGTLPATAPNTFQGLTTTLTYTFTATQRAAVATQ